MLTFALSNRRNLVDTVFKRKRQRATLYSFSVSQRGALLILIVDMIDFDLIIVGGGPVALALVGWLTQRSATRALSVALIDASPATEVKHDPRVLALSHGSRILLEPLAWPLSATPIKHIHISRRGQCGRTLLDHDEYNLPALGYVLRYGTLLEALSQAVKTTGNLHRFSATTAGSPTRQADHVTLPIKNAQGTHLLRTQLLINAQGGPFAASPVTPDAPPRRRTRSYMQAALVGTVSASMPRPNVAWERFTHEGPLALLPLGGAHKASYAFVWCCQPEQAQRRLSLTDEEFAAELNTAFGQKMGHLSVIDKRHLIPLALNALETLVEDRIVAIGNAAQTLHPVAGQGLNLGLRDAYTLVETLGQFGVTPLALTTFAKRRRPDRQLTISLTDKLARIFTSEYDFLGGARSQALTALSCVPLFKAILARHMLFGRRR